MVSKKLNYFFNNLKEFSNLVSCLVSVTYLYFRKTNIITQITKFVKFNIFVKFLKLIKFCF